MADDLIFTGDAIEELFIPIEMNWRKTIKSGAMEFAGQPVRLSEGHYTHNKRHLQRLLDLGYVVVSSHVYTDKQQSYTHYVLYDPKNGNCSR